MSSLPPTPFGPDTIFLVDGHYQLYRAFHALQQFSTSDGRPTNVVFGFYLTLQRLFLEHRPKALAVVFDAGHIAFRAELYPEYKANRDEMEDEMRDQIPLVHDLLDALAIPRLELEGFEADDIIATLATHASAQEREVIIASADKDLFQVVGPHVRMLRTTPDKREADLFDAAAVVEKMGVTPAQMVDFQAIVGDTSDNIPGLPGLGPKFAAILLEHYPEGITQMYADPDLAASLKAIKGFGPSKVKAVMENREKAAVSRQLAYLLRDVPLDLNFPEGLHVGTPDEERFVELLKDLEFGSVLKEIEQGRNVFLHGHEAAAQGRADQKSSAAAAGEKSDDPSPSAGGQTNYPPAILPPNRKEPRVPNYRNIVDIEDLKEVAAAIRATGFFAFDTETSQLDPMLADMVGISLAWEKDAGVYIPVGHDPMYAGTRQLGLGEVRDELADLFADPKIGKAAHHAKYDVKILKRHGFEVNGLSFDTLVAAHLWDATLQSHGLKPLSLALLGIEMQPIKDLIGSGKKQLSMSEVTVDAAGPYASADADCTLQLAEALKPVVAEIGSMPLHDEVEVPLIDVLARMEMEGIKLDKDFLAGLANKTQEELDELQKRIHAAAETPFNLNSPKQVAEVLFERLKLPPQKKTKSGYSTDVTVLEALRSHHPIVEDMLQFRVLEKLQSTYILALPNEVNRRTGRVHCSFNQSGAATGRLSCNNPNLQNIPTRTALGREIRRAFVASSEENILLAADYSQIELRILAHMSGDEALQRAFCEGDDIHRLTASKIYGIPQDEVQRDQRGVGKTINFGIVYGMSAFRLANDLDLEQSDAKRFIKEYFRGYPKVAEWIEQTKRFVRAKGYSETLRGRRRPIPDIGAKNHNARSGAERIAVNTPIQGTAADMIKLAMVKLDARLRNELPACKMLLQVHDELVFELPKDAVEAATPLIREEMANALPLDVPVEVDIAFGGNWAECK